MRDWRDNFSLVELLVVITMLMLLASMLLPTVVRIRREASRTACQGNLRQLGIAYKLFADERGDYPTPYFNKPFRRSVPIMMHAEEYDAMRDEYNFDYNDMRCPAASLNHATYTKKNKMPRYGYLTYPNYANLNPVGRGKPKVVGDSARGADDSDADHLLAGDLVMMYRNRWSRSLTWNGGAVNHLDEDLLPDGMSVLYVDGRTDWRQQDEINISKAAFEYREGRNRYFW